MPKQAAVSLVAVFTKPHLHTELNAVCDENRSFEKLSWLGEKAEMLRCHIAKIWLNVSVRRPTKWGCARTVSFRCAIMPLPTEKGKTKGKSSNPMFVVTKTMSARVIVFFSAYGTIITQRYFCKHDKRQRHIHQKPHNPIFMPVVM